MISLHLLPWQTDQISHQKQLLLTISLSFADLQQQRQCLKVSKYSCYLKTNSFFFTTYAKVPPLF